MTSSESIHPLGQAPPRTVVIAEDESIIRLDLAEILEENGFSVIGQTGRGDEAVELVRSLRPDAAVLDIKMPGMDGLTAARQIGTEKLSAVVILTSFSQAELVSEATAAGVGAYVVKPFQASDVVPALEIAISRFADLMTATERAAAAEEALETRKVIDRAKGILMDGHSMSERDAFTFLQRTAMGERRQMRAVAAEVVAGTLTPDAPPRP